MTENGLLGRRVSWEDTTKRAPADPQINRGYGTVLFVVQSPQDVWVLVEPDHTPGEAVEFVQRHISRLLLEPSRLELYNLSLAERGKPITEAEILQHGHGMFWRELDARNPDVVVGTDSSDRTHDEQSRPMTDAESTAALQRMGLIGQRDANEAERRRLRDAIRSAYADDGKVREPVTFCGVCKTHHDHGAP